MTDDISPEGRAYLRRLESALADLPGYASADIISGIREELTGLSPDETRLRIDAVGDPEFVAAEARRESAAADRGNAPADRRNASADRVNAAADPPLVTKRRASESPAFTIVAALLVLTGGLVIPFVGALAGYVMMWVSRAWTTRDKAFATLLPIAVLVGVAMLISVSSVPSNSASGMPMDSYPFAWWTAILAVFPAFFVAGAWLLWRSARLRVAED